MSRRKGSLASTVVKGIGKGIKASYKKKKSQTKSLVGKMFRRRGSNMASVGEEGGEDYDPEEGGEEEEEEEEGFDGIDEDEDDEGGDRGGEEEEGEPLDLNVSEVTEEADINMSDDVESVGSAEDQDLTLDEDEQDELTDLIAAELSSLNELNDLDYDWIRFRADLPSFTLSVLDSLGPIALAQASGLGLRFTQKGLPGQQKRAVGIELALRTVRVLDCCTPGTK